MVLKTTSTCIFSTNGPVSYVVTNVQISRKRTRLRAVWTSSSSQLQHLNCPAPLPEWRLPPLYCCPSRPQRMYLDTGSHLWYSTVHMINVQSAHKNQACPSGRCARWLSSLSLVWHGDMDNLWSQLSSITPFKQEEQRPIWGPRQPGSYTVEANNSPHNRDAVKRDVITGCASNFIMFSQNFYFTLPPHKTHALPRENYKGFTVCLGSMSLWFYFSGVMHSFTFCYLQYTLN